MGMKDVPHEPQGKLCECLSIPGPKDVGPVLPEANLVSSMKVNSAEGGICNGPNLVTCRQPTTSKPG